MSVFWGRETSHERQRRGRARGGQATRRLQTEEIRKERLQIVLPRAIRGSCHSAQLVEITSAAEFLKRISVLSSERVSLWQR